MSNSSLLADKLVFCGKTALEIAHSFNDANIDATRSPLSALPKRPLPDPALKQLAGRPSATTPPIRFSFPAHLLFHGDVRHKQTILRIPHRCTNIPKGRHFLKVDKNVYAASANLALCQMADEAKEMLDLLLLLWEACGIYRTDLTWMESTYETAPLTSVRSLARFMSENPKIHGTGKIRRVLHYVRDGSASVRETQIALFLGLPTRYGGFNLGLPQMNHRVDASQEAKLIGGRSHFRCDLCWPDQKIDIEYQSDESHEGKLMRIKDSRRTNALISMGWHVVNVTNNEAQSLTTLERIAEHVRVLLRKRSHPATRETSIKRFHLHRRLGIARDDLALPSSLQK